METFSCFEAVPLEGYVNMNQLACLAVQMIVDDKNVSVSLFRENGCSGFKAVIFFCTSSGSVADKREGRIDDTHA